MSTDSWARLRVAALIYCVVNAVIFGVGVIVIMSFAMLDAFFWMPAVVVSSFVISAPPRVVHRVLDDDALYQGALTSLNPNVPTLLIVALLIAPVSALGQPLAGNPLKGRQTATAICAPCHQTDGKRPDGVAPSFLDVANMTSTTALSLRVFLRTSHNEMPNLIISEADTDDLIAYILALKKPSVSKRP